MLDRQVTQLIKPAIEQVATALLAFGFRANQVTLAGFGLGVLAAGAIAGQHYLVGAALMQTAERIPPRSLVICISDFLTPPEPIELGLRRLAHEPVAYIRGYQEFWDQTLTVTPATLIPRGDSEVLVERALHDREFIADEDAAHVAHIELEGFGHGGVDAELLVDRKGGAGHPGIGLVGGHVQAV